MDYLNTFDATRFAQAEATHLTITADDLAVIFEEAVGHPLDVLQLFHNHNLCEGLECT